MATPVGTAPHPGVGLKGVGNPAVGLEAAHKHIKDGGRSPSHTGTPILKEAKIWL